jgi:hypothetical protein
MLDNQLNSITVNNSVSMIGINNYANFDYNKFPNLTMALPYTDVYYPYVGYTERNDDYNWTLYAKDRQYITYSDNGTPSKTVKPSSAISSLYWDEDGNFS